MLDREDWSAGPVWGFGVGGGGLEQRAGGAAGQRRALAVGGAGSYRQHVVVARNVAVSGKVVRVLHVTGEPGDRHGNNTLDNTDSRLWRRE